MFSRLAPPLLCAALACAGLPLTAPALAAPKPAASSPAAANSASAVAVVSKLLSLRAKNNFAGMYPLLSLGFQELLPRSQFLAGSPESPIEISRMSPVLRGVYALLGDPHNTLKYTFTVIGPDPKNPAVVLVRALPPSALGAVPVTLKVYTLSEPGAGASRRQVVDAVATMKAAAPSSFRPDKSLSKRELSQRHLKQLALAINEYLQDHDETMPDAAKWADQIRPYVKDTTIFHDPFAPASQPYGYAFNRTLSRQSLAALYVPDSTVMLFESTKGVKNAADTGQSVLRPGRDAHGTDYAFADGNVKWLPDGTKLSYTLMGKYK